MINYGAVVEFDHWLDAKVSQPYHDQHLAQDWARISKVAEELGEAIQAFIGYTGQNPRKGFTHDLEKVLNELADTALTAIYAIQHFTKRPEVTAAYIAERQALHVERMIANS